MSGTLREQIEDFYLPKQLVEAILEVGGIPRESEEAEVGIGFIDIANYTFLSKFLTPKENQQVLNGLYTAFNSVLRRHGGYLNKIEGDSLMFHYGGLIDAKARKVNNTEELRSYIARELFFTCVEMQRVAVLFNDADARFLDDAATPTDRRVLEQAFEIIARLRTDDEVSNPLSAMFQIRIRVGANLGEVTIGNFGPEGARQWDVIGMPVIDAKRMETTAPIGGFRISRYYYDILLANGIVDEYFERFRREAGVLGSRYATITRDELFRIRHVTIAEKGNALYETVSIQVNPRLPEQIADQVDRLLDRGRHGGQQIIELLKYYRGNRHIVDAIEGALVNRGVSVRRSEIFGLMYPTKFARLLRKNSDDHDLVEQMLLDEHTLYGLMTRLGNYQDIINRSSIGAQETIPFSSYSEHFERAKQAHVRRYEERKSEMAQRAYFFNVVFPLVFDTILGAILEFQSSTEELEMLGG